MLKRIFVFFIFALSFFPVSAEKIDVNELLDQADILLKKAWEADDNAQFDKSKKLYEQYLQFLTQAADAGSANTCFKLARHYSITHSPESIKWAKEGAERGDPEAMELLGQKYFVGKEIEQNWLKTHYYYMLAIKIGGEKHMRGTVERVRRLERRLTAEQIANTKKLLEEFKPKTISFGQKE